MTNNISLDLLTLLVLRANNALTGDDLVAWALRALEAGTESPNLITLAGLPTRSCRADAEPYFERALQELKIAVPSTELLLRQYVVSVAEQIIDERIEVRLALEEIHRYVINPLNHPEDLSGWCYLWEGNSPDLSYPPPSQSSIAKLAKEHAVRYLSQVKQHNDE